MRISVVIATYNQREYVLETVKSVVEQTAPAHEIIVVDDGSTDGTAEAVTGAFPQVKVIRQENRGKGIARNTGVAAATGDWIAFTDHDDLWHRDKLKYTAEYVREHGDCEAVNHALWFFSDRESGPTAAYGFRRDFVAKNVCECHAAIADRGTAVEDKGHLDILGDSFARLLERNRGALSASVVKREILLRAGGFCPMQANGEDWTMFLNVARLTEWHTIPHRLAFIRLHAGQDTHKPEGAIMILSGLVNAWYTGRPLCKPLAKWDDVYREVVRYAGEYRRLVQTFYWSALRRGDFRSARHIRKLGSLLLVRRRDRWYALLPPQVTWRWERHVRGMHK